jgi:hypothetical protein
MRRSGWGIDRLVANAGVSTMRRAVEITDEEWENYFRSILAACF